LQKKKLEESSSRQGEKGADWYSKLRKTPEQIKEEKIRLRRVWAENIAKEKRKLTARKAKECIQCRKEAAKKAKEEETQREQDRNDRAIALYGYSKSITRMNLTREVNQSRATGKENLKNNWNGT
jgi:hypothetical protein